MQRETTAHTNHFATPDAVVADRRETAGAGFRRFTIALTVFGLVPTLLLAIFVIVIDPYYVFGSPQWRGVNQVKPYYERGVLAAKPYQVHRSRPSAVALGSSRVEAGIDPRHKAWVDGGAFNFGMPAPTSYGVMLAFVHAQDLARPLKQAVVGLDFYAYNANFTVLTDFLEQRFVEEASSEFVRFLDERFPDWQPLPNGPVAKNPGSPADTAWDELLYLTVNGDVAAAVANKVFASGRQHYELAGRAERRQGAFIPSEWDEDAYLRLHQDVADAVAHGRFLNGYHHYLAAGRREGRLGGLRPSDWNEAAYLAANPDARAQVMLGLYPSGYLHYAAKGRKEGRVGGFPAAGVLEMLQQRSPLLGRLLFQGSELFRFVLSSDAVYDSIGTMFRQSEPATFDESGMRVWRGYDKFLSELGGPGGPFHKNLRDRNWRPWFAQPALAYCFTNVQASASMFEPYRFMLRRAHAGHTDLRLYVTPLPAAMRYLIAALGLQEHYEYWLRELSRINEEEATRAGREPMPLWDFGDVNTITAEMIPASGDHTLMRWYWEHTHYRSNVGDLILDRIHNHNEPSRTVPPDFGVRLSGSTIDTHLARNKVMLADWAVANNDLASEITSATQMHRARDQKAGANCW